MFVRIVLLIVWVAVRNAASSHEGAEEYLHRRLTQHESFLLSDMQSASFVDFVSKRSDANENLFLYVLVNRAELQDINWQDPNVEAIASQLEALAKIEADTSWRNRFNACIRTLMKVHEWNEDKSKELQDFLTQLNIKKRKKEYRRRLMAKGKSEEQKEKEAVSRRKSRELRRVEHKQGRGLPLLLYINRPYKKEASQFDSPEIWHEEALKYRDMYRSCKSFIQALRGMFDKLGYPDGETLKYRQDERNFNFEPWEWIRADNDNISTRLLHNFTAKGSPSIDTSAGPSIKTVASESCSRGHMASPVKDKDNMLEEDEQTAFSKALMHEKFAIPYEEEPLFSPFSISEEPLLSYDINARYLDNVELPSAEWEHWSPE